MGDFDADEMSIWPVNLTHIIGRAAGRRPVPTPNLLAMVDNPPRHQLEQVLPRVDTIEPLPSGQTRDVVLVNIGLVFPISTMMISTAEIWGLQRPIAYRESVIAVLRKAIRRGYTIVMYNDVYFISNSAGSYHRYYERRQAFLISKLPGVKIIPSLGHPQILVNYITLDVRPSARSVLIDDDRVLDASSGDQYGYLPLAERLQRREVDILRFSLPETFPRREFNLAEHLTPRSTNLFVLMGVGPISIVEPLVDRLVDAGMTLVANVDQIPGVVAQGQSHALLYNLTEPNGNLNVDLTRILVTMVGNALGPGYRLAARVLWFATSPDNYTSDVSEINRINRLRHTGDGARAMQLLEEPPIRVEV